MDGYLAWKLRVDAMIASNHDLSMFAGIDTVTESLATAGVPGFAAMAPAEKAQVLRETAARAQAEMIAAHKK